MDRIQSARMILKITFPIWKKEMKNTFDLQNGKYKLVDSMKYELSLSCNLYLSDVH